MNNFYVSTRDKQVHLTSKEAILKGISDDGGLFVWPDLADVKIDLNRVCQNNYKENAVYILSKLLHDFTKEELEQCVNNAYTDTFASKDIIPVRKVGDIYVLELFHGPTSAFKDVALTLLPQLMSVALEKTDQKALIFLFLFCICDIGLFFKHALAQLSLIRLRLLQLLCVCLFLQHFAIFDRSVHRIAHRSDVGRRIIRVP